MKIRTGSGEPGLWFSGFRRVEQGSELDKILKVTPAVLMPLLGLLLSAVLVRYSIGWLCRHGFAAAMGERHIHKRVIPTAGGIGMIAAFVAALLVYQLWSRMSGEVSPLNLAFLVPAGILLLVGLYDDRWNMRPEWKLLGQVAAGVTAWLCGSRFAPGGCPLPDYVSCPLTIFWFLLFINAFNLIDGLDGLAAGLAVLGAASLSAMLVLERRLDIVVIPLTLIGVCLGFLRYNFHPARVFMGDTGSMFLGYMLAGIGLETSNQGTSFFAILAPIMACGVPLIDTSLAVWRRATFKILSQSSWREIMSADRSHLHHRILEAQQSSQSRTALIIYLLAAVLGLVGLVAGMIGNALPALAILLVLLTMVLVLRKFAVLEMWNSTQLVFKGLAMPRKSVFVNVLHPAYDFTVLVAAFVLARLLHGGWEFDIVARQIVISTLPLMVLLAVSGTYRVFWLRAGTADHVRLVYHITFGFLILFGVYVLAGTLFHADWPLWGLWIAYLMTVVGILGERILLIWVQILLPRYYRDSEFNHDCVTTLLYGAGGQLPSYQRYSSLHWHSRGERVVGIVDNDKALHGQFVCGYRILGGLDRLEELYLHYFFTKIVVITEKPIRTNLEILRRFCDERKITLKFFTMSEADQPLGIREPEAENPPA